MSRQLRWTIILTNGIAAGAIFLFCRSVLPMLPAVLATPLLVEQQWLAGILGLYVLNYAVAFRFRQSFSITAGRMLFFAVAGFVILSHTIDILGEHREILSQVVSWDSHDPLIRQLQARLVAMAGMISLCLVCIAVGFEAADSAGDPNK